MKTRVAWLALATFALVAGSATAQVQRIFNNSATNNSYWSNSGNWKDGEIADTNGEWVQLNAPVCELDADFTVNRIQNSFGTAEGGVTGPGTLTIDRNSASLQTAIINVRGGTNGAVAFTLDCNIVITNSLGGISTVQNNTLNENVVRFGTNSVLTLNSKLQTANGTGGGTIEFNGALAGESSVNTLIFGSTNVVFGSTADNAGFNGDLVFSANSRVIADIDGGLLLKKGRKLQINGTGGRIELNGANILDANINIGGANVFTLVANANQDDVGFVDYDTGGLVIDLGPETTELLFDDSSARDWSTGTLVISNFASGVIGFGVSSNGLTAGQLAVISAYDTEGVLVPDLAINASGYLTGTVTGDPGGPVEVGDIALGLINGGSAVTISWASTNGANYGVSNTADLVFGPWTLLTNGVIGTGGSLSITNPTDQSVEFFKVFSE